MTFLFVIFVALCEIKDSCQVWSKPMLIIDTILLRPYVFIFFLLYLLGCTLHLGVLRALLFCVGGYGIAWLTELSSIHTGFPYGSYYYIEATRGQELWVLGVPFMDSLSYVFLAYASYSLALLLVSPVRGAGWSLYLLETRKIRDSRFTALLATVLFVYLDIIIDPVALRGHRWFLGQIYGYPDGGVYFGVPLSNFAGWFITGGLLVLLLQRTDNALWRWRVPDLSGRRYAGVFLIGPGLYLGVLLFNLAMTFYIGEGLIGWVGVFIVLLPALLAYARVRDRLKMREGREEWSEHLADFPFAHPAPALKQYGKPVPETDEPVLTRGTE
jgi:putative membrane protein